MHSFDRFYVGTKFILPSINDLNFSPIDFHEKCSFLDHDLRRHHYAKQHVSHPKMSCEKIIPLIDNYKKQIFSYDCTAHMILMNEISLYFQIFHKKEKRGIITSLISFIGLVYEGISSYMHNKRQKALHKGFVAMENKVNLQHNKMFLLENSKVMYGIYNSETLEKLIDTVHKMHTTTWNEELFPGKLDSWYNYYLFNNGIGHYVMNSLIFKNIKGEIY